MKRVSGKNNYHWNGGVYKSQGYVFVLSPNHPYASARDRYVKRSHLAVEKHLGRFIKPNERVHHINGIKDDDRIENLKLFSNESEHIRLHTTKYPVINGLKECSLCHNKFSLLNFYFVKISKDNKKCYQSRCKKCTKIRSHSTFPKN